MHTMEKSLTHARTTFVSAILWGVLQNTTNTWAFNY